MLYHLYAGASWKEQRERERGAFHPLQLRLHGTERGSPLSAVGYVCAEDVLSGRNSIEG